MTSSVESKECRWSWVILFAAFTMNVICGGSLRSFGLILSAITEGEANAGRGGLGYALHGSLFLFSAPLSNYLLTKLPARKIIFIFGLSYSASYSLCIFSSGLTYITLVYGVIGGCSFGMIYSPFFVLIAEYFDRRRPLACGLAVCGTCLGGVFYPPLTNYLLENLGSKGTMLVLGGLALHLCVIALLCRSYEDNLQLHHTIPEKVHIEVTEDSSQVISNINKFQINSYDYTAGCPDEMASKYDSSYDKMQSPFSVHHIDILPTCPESEELQLMETNTIENPRQLSRLATNFKPDNSGVPSLATSFQSLQQGINFDHLISRLEEVEKGCCYAQICQIDKLCKRFPTLVLLTDCRMATLLPVSLMLNTGVSSFFIIIPNLLNENPFCDASMFLSVLMGTEFVGRLAHGLIAILPRYPHKAAAATCLVLMVSFWIGLCFTNSKSVFLTLGGCFGFAIGGFSGVEITAVFSCVDDSHLLGPALAYYMCAGGIGCFVGPLIFGFVRDYLGSWIYSLLASALVVLSAAVMLIAVVLRNCCTEDKPPEPTDASNLKSAAQLLENTSIPLSSSQESGVYET